MSPQESQGQGWVLYLLECENGALYAGITNDLEGRFKAHQAGKGARFTRANRPVRIAASMGFPDRSTASKAEWTVKKLPRRRKMAFFNTHQPPGDPMSDTTKHPSLMDALYSHAAAIKSLTMADALLQLPQFAGIREQLDDIAGKLMTMQTEIPSIQAAMDTDASATAPRPRT